MAAPPPQGTRAGATARGGAVLRGPRRWSDAALRRSAHGIGVVQVLVAAAVVGLQLWVPGTVPTETGVLRLVLTQVLVLAFPVVGLLVLERYPRHTVGWLMVAVGAAWTVAVGLQAYSVLGIAVLPGALPLATVAAALASGGWVPFIGLIGTFLVLLIPDGRLPGPGWRWVGRLSAVVLVAIPVVIALQPGDLQGVGVDGVPNPLRAPLPPAVMTTLLGLLLPVLGGLVLVCATAPGVRFRRSHGAARQQLKLIAVAVAAAAVLFVGPDVVGALTRSGPGAAWVRVAQDVSLLSFLLVPLAIGTAVLRHGLFDVDVVINRTLVYGPLTIGLLGVYVGSVLLLQVVLRPFTGGSDLAVAVSTLAAAALFRPGRTAIQRAVDRRFYRRRYDAARTLEAFGARLRSELDLQAVGEDLRSVVDETVQPSSVRLWLRGAP